MSQMLHFQFESDPMTLGVGGGTEILETKYFGKPLEWRDWDET